MSDGRHEMYPDGATRPSDIQGATPANPPVAVGSLHLALKAITTAGGTAMAPNVHLSAIHRRIADAEHKLWHQP